MQFTSRIEKFGGNLWGHHFVVPVTIAEAFIDGKNRRVICRLQDSVDFPCALMHKGDGMYFINVNKKIRTQLGLKEGSAIDVVLQKDDSKYGMPMPEEMEAVLETDDTGRAYFDALTPGKQRSLLYIVAKPKNSDIRIRKALVVMEHLLEQKGKLDFKILNQDFKNKKHL